MAFGKDPNRLSGLGGNWMQRAKSQATNRGGKGGGGKFHWRDNYQPTEATEGDIIRIFDGNFLQKFPDKNGNIVEDTQSFVAFREHRDINERTCICSAGPLWGQKGKADLCPCCELFWDDVAERRAKKNRGDTTKGPNRMSCIDRYAFMIWDYGPYTQVYDVDRQTGQVRMNSKTNQPFTSWEKGHPNEPQFNGRAIAWKTGNLLPWVLTMTQRAQLMKQNEIIGLACASCGTRSAIICNAKVCTTCGVVAYDPNATTLTPEQREQIDNNPHQCTNSNCGHVGYLGEMLQCRACPTPKRTTIFDVDLNIMKMKAGEKQVIINYLNYSEVRPPQIAPEVWATLEPLDLIGKFKATPPDDQRKFMTFPTSRQQQQVPTQGQVPMNFQQQQANLGPQGFMPPQYGAMPQGWGMAFNPAQFGPQNMQPQQQPQMGFQPPQFAAMPTPMVQQPLQLPIGTPMQPQFGQQAIPYNQGSGGQQNGQ